MSRSTKFRNLRILIVGAKPYAARVLRTVLGQLGIIEITLAPTAENALMQLSEKLFDAVFCDEYVESIGNLPFAIAARRSHGVRNPMIPLFFTCEGPRRRDVEAARSEGVTDVLAVPVSAAIVMRKLSLALERPRPFIVAQTFVGPDRRASDREPFDGDERRSRKTRKIKVPKPVDAAAQ